MAAVISLAETDTETFNLVDVMDYRITDECLSIYNVNGTMRKTQKSKFYSSGYNWTDAPYHSGCYG